MSPRRGAGPGIVVALAIVASLAGCLGEEVPSVAPTPTREPEPTPISTTYDVGATVWYTGLVFHLDRVVSVLDARGGPVDVMVRVQNPSPDPVEVQATILLKVGDALHRPTRDSRIPVVPPGSEVSSVLTYELQGIATIADAGIQVGEPPSHLGYAPLTAAGGTAVTLEPRTLTLAGEVSAGDLQIELMGGVQRWDLPDYLVELPADRQVLSVTFDATFTGGFSGGFAFTHENIALRLPDGTTVAPRADGHSRPAELIGPGKTRQDLTARFELPADVVGTVLFVVLDNTEDREGSIPLVIPG